MTEKSVTRVCSLENCSRPILVKGLCPTHYHRLRRTGDPMGRIRGGYGDTHTSRFWSKVAVTADPCRCWEWLHSVNNNGYGVVHARGKRWLAHRYAWFLVYGVEPTQCLLHSCDNPKCLNPNHLREGTHQENAYDKMERGRQPSGEKVWNARLLNSDVANIRQAIQDGVRKTDIARQYGILKSTVSGIASGRLYKDS